MSSQLRLSKTQLVKCLMYRTPATYQKRLALAHHWKMVGNNPNLSNRFGVLEQEAGKRLAETKYPLSRELKAQMQAGKLDELTLLNTAIPTVDANEPVDGQEVNLSETIPEKAQGQAGFDQMRESFPRITPGMR